MSVNGGRLHTVDVIILTAIPLEYEAALLVNAGAVQGTQWVEERLPNGLRVSFRSFHGKKNGRPLRVALAVAGGMGAVETLNALLPLVKEYRPRCVAMCGVCAGRPGKTNLGDIIAPDRLFFHDTGKRRPEGVQQDLTTYSLRYDWNEDLKHFDFVARFKDEPWWKDRPVPYEWQENWALLKLYEGVTAPWMLPEFKQYCPQWKKVIDGLWKSGHVQPQSAKLTDKGRDRVEGLLLQHEGRLPDLSPTGELLPFRVHVDPMGSGSQVIEDVAYWDSVSEHMRKTLGLEMEAAALGALARSQSHLKLDALVMKGVMDFANHGRDDHFKEYAARASAECLMVFLREHLDVDVVPGVDDLLKTGSAGEPPANAPPSALLNARHEVVPFHGRQTALTELERWCDEGPPVTVQLLHAEGGAGKTRLAIELVRRRREQGWSAGFLAKDVPEDWMEQLWSSGQPVLVVLDYAESHPDLPSVLYRLLRYSAQQGAATLRRMRLLLLARNAGDWWKSLRQKDTELGSWLGTMPARELPPLAANEAERIQTFHEAAERFAAKLGKPYARSPTAPVLSDEHFERVLYVHMAALAAVEGLAFEATTLTEVILDHEERFWQIQAGQAPARLAVQHFLARQVVAAATLRGGLPDREEAALVMGRLLRRTMSMDEESLLLLLSWVYQRPGSGPVMFLPSLEPDLLGEAMVLRVVSSERSSRECVPSDWMDRVFPSEERAPIVRTGMEVLGRASAAQPAAIRPWIERLLVGPLLRDRAPLALEAAKAIGQSTAFSVLGDVLAARLEVEGDAEQARQLEAMDIPFSSVSLVRVGEWASRLQLKSLPITQNELGLVKRAHLLNNQALRLSTLGRRKEALTAIAEAVTLYRTLNEHNAGALQPDLANSLSNLGVMQSNMGLREEALKTTGEAVEIYRRLAERNVDAIQPDLASSLSNLGARLGDLGRQEEALKATNEAVAIYRRLAERNADAFQPKLASSLNNQGLLLLNLGQRQEALKAADEAVWLRRRLAERNADAFQSDLARSLSNLGITLSALSSREEALKATDEAVALYRRLAERNADAFQPELGSSLGNLGARLSDMGLREEALETTAEAVALYRSLAERNADAFQPDLAGILNNMGAMLNNMGRREEALKATDEAVALYRRLAERNADAFQADLARVLHNLGARLSGLGRREDALKATDEAVQLRRRLAERNAAAFQADLARSLSNLGVMLSALNRQQEALKATDEAVALYSTLAERNADAFLPDFANSLSNLGLRLSSLGLWEKALEATDEAVALYRRLAERHADTFQASLAGGLNNLGLMLSNLGRHEEALLAVGEAVDRIWPFFLRFPTPLGQDTGRLLLHLEELYDSFQRPLPPELQERIVTFQRLTAG